MKRWLKKHFIPTEGNSYRPYFLRLQNMSQMVGIVILFELIFFVFPVVNFTSIYNALNLGAVLPGMLSTLTNVEREQNNLPDLVVSPTLTAAAQLKAEDMAKKSYFAHTSPEGLTPWYWFEKVGYKYSYAGENLAVNFTDSEDVTEAWMNSPGHRANIVGAGYQEVGTGIATGVYEGEETVFVAQLYGTPAKKVVSVVSQPVAKQENSTRVGAPVERVKRSDLTASSTGLAASSPSSEVLGESQPPIVPQQNVGEKILKEPKFWQKVFSSPRQAMNGALYAVLAIVVIALFLNIVIKFEYQHPDLILNGVVATIFIFGLYFTNGYITKNNFETSFISFDSAHTLIK